MHAGRPVCCRTVRCARAAAIALASCALSVAAVPAARAQRSQRDIPVMTVPTGLPPSPAKAPAAATSVEDAISAALRAAGATAPGAPDAAFGRPAVGAPEALPRPNPFVSNATPPAGAAGPEQSAPNPADGQPSLLLPLPGSQGGENLAVSGDDSGLVSLAVREGSLRQVISMIAQTQKLNIVFAGANDVMVTASFERQPWRKVLDALLSASGHVWTTHDGVIFVSSVDAADFMPPGAGGLQVEVFELDFASATDLDQAVKGMLSPAGKSWVNESMNTDNRRTKETIAVVDYPAHLARVRDYISQADQPPRQVFIQAHILQVELTDDCSNGINFEHLISMSGAKVGLKNVGFANAEPKSAFVVDVDGVGLDGIVELLQNTADTKTLASPEISVVSGQTSKMQIGDQLPYRNTATTQTASLQSAQFLDVGIVLEVTPRVTRDGRVLMRIKPEVSTGEYRPEAEGLPSKKTTQVETDVLMCSGQGMVLGGLIQETDSNVQSKLPFFGDIPYLGILFQKRHVVKSRKEIIVTLRPYVLPYSQIQQARQDHKIMRTEMPLTQGAICSYPRPYEPNMKDTFDHHYVKHPLVAMVPPNFPLEPVWEPGDPAMMDLPSVNAQWGQGMEELPAGTEELPQ